MPRQAISYSIADALLISMLMHLGRAEYLRRILVLIA